MPPSWNAAPTSVNPETHFNFVCTADIIGGNSGSPAVNTRGEVIGLIFDGNIHSLPGAFHYDDRMNRAVAVDIRGLLEALEKVYGAKELVAEIGK
jgi:S1-C subfamily serine protease